MSGRLLALLVWSAALLLTTARCDPPFEPPAGAIRVAAQTSGTDLDPDGYAVQVDSAAAQPVPANGALTIPVLEIGDHSVTLGGIAANCRLSDSPVRTVVVTAGAITDVLFAVDCSRLEGSIRVVTATAGADLDYDGYVATVDSGAGLFAPTTGLLNIAGVAAGPHTLTLSGVAPNCAVGSPNPVTLSVSFGALTIVTFAITCAAVPGG